MKEMKKLLALLLAVVLTLSLFAGCSSETATDAGNTTDAADSTDATDTADTDAVETGDAAPEEIVPLTFYMTCGVRPEADRIMEKANEIIEKEIGAHLEIIDADAEKINLMISTGDEFDLCFMGNWGGYNFFENAAAGAFVDMAPLFEKYAPETYSRIPEALWKGVSIGDAIYGSVNYQQWGVASQKGFAVRMDIAEEVGYDWQKLKGMPANDVLRDLENFFEPALELYPEMIGWESSATYNLFANDPLYYDMEPVGDMLQPGWVRFEEPDTVINQFETEEFAEFCEIMREYNQKGYVRADAATVQDPSPDRRAGRMLAGTWYSWPDMIDYQPTGVEELTIAGFEAANYTIPEMSMTPKGTCPAGQISTTRTVIPAAAGPTACVAISATSKHPEKAMELIELLNTNDELFNLLQWGEEDVDYYYDEDGNFQRVEGKYTFNYNEWQMGQSYSPDFARSDFGRQLNAAQKDTAAKQEIIFEADRTATPSPVTGFTFDPEPVKTELANCSAIITEMVPVLGAGAADPAEYLPQFLQRLKDAGVDTIIAEKQAQLDAWHAAGN